MTLKTPLTLALAVALLAPAIVRADWACQVELAKKEDVLVQVRKQAAQGQATQIDVIHAEIAVSDKSFACGLTTKRHYCLYQQTVRARLVTELAQSGDTEASQDVQDGIALLKAWCKTP